MKRTKLFILSILLLAAVTACKDQLDIQNPNQPTPATASTESGIASLAQGAVYVNGFRELKYSDGVPGFYWTGAKGFHELMADVVGEEAANQYGNQIGCPEYVILDNATKVLNPNAPNQQIPLLRGINVNANAGQNPTFYEWAYMYGMNNGCNSVIQLSETVQFAGDAATKKATVQAWAYWWKGYAYSNIGSIYFAGIINDEVGTTNANYVSKEKIIEEANKNFDKAATLLTGITATADYTTMLRQLIPSFMQVGKGVIPTPDMWKRNINTYKARNLLVNTTTKAMTAAQWNQILTLTNDGVKSTDNVFTARSNDNGDVISALNGSLAAKITGRAISVTYKVSERLIQDFPVGDKRLTNNFSKLAAAWVGNTDRGNAFNTRYELLNKGMGMKDVVVLSNQDPGQYELYLASTYEENDLMNAEAKLYTGNIEGGLKLIDGIRTAQGAGIPAVAGAGLTLEAAKEELRKERRVALVFRALSFYDARRWGVIDDISKGGGRTKAVVVDKAGVVSTNATINYNYLDYWDVPDNEIVYNPPASGSAPTKNPK